MVEAAEIVIYVLEDPNIEEEISDLLVPRVEVIIDEAAE